MLAEELGWLVDGFEWQIILDWRKLSYYKLS